MISRFAHLSLIVRAHARGGAGRGKSSLRDSRDHAIYPSRRIVIIIKRLCIRYAD